MQRAQVMLIDDSLSDQTLMSRCSEDGFIDGDILPFTTSADAVSFLRRPPETTRDSTSLPDLILLDINLTPTNGLLLLRELKNDVQLKHLPILMLTTSSRPKDVIEAYRYGANAFLIKPTEERKYALLAKHINDFWLHTAILPTPSINTLEL